MKLHEIFEHVGLDRAGIAAAAKKARHPFEPELIVRHPDQRPNCLICGRRINKRNCKPFRQKKHEPRQQMQVMQKTDQVGTDREGSTHPARS